MVDSISDFTRLAADTPDCQGLVVAVSMFQLISHFEKQGGGFNQYKVVNLNKTLILFK